MITRYVLVDKQNITLDHLYEESEFDEAQRDAERLDCAVVAYIFTFSDSELVWAPDGGSVWPPREQGNEETET